MFNLLKERINTLRGISTSGFTRVFIETQGSCTNKSYMCPNRSGNQSYRGKMSDETFKLIIAKLKEVDYSHELHLYTQNEPFLDKSIIEKIYYAKQQLPNAKIILISNFTVLNDDLIDKILKAPIYNFSCSVYALDAENYKEITGRNNFKNAFINQVKFLKKYGLTIPFSYANYIIHSPGAMKDIEFIKHYIFDIAPVSFAQEGKVSTIFSSMHDKLKPTNKFYSDCIYTGLRFSENGNIGICNCDKDDLLTIENIYSLTGTLKDLYNSPKARSYRKRMFSFNVKDRKNYCQYCDFRRSQTLLDYLLCKKINQNDKYKHKLKTQRNSNEEINKKFQKFNEIFKDGEEEKWIEILENLRKDFYLVNTYKKSEV